MGTGILQKARERERERKSIEKTYGLFRILFPEGVVL
jgi:hypothetical protein